MRLRPSGAGTIYLHRHPVDMRKSINGLVAIVESEMALDPFSASLFVFCNRTRTLVKLVGWEGNGFVLWMKRLDKLRFQWPLSLELDTIELNAQQVNWLLDGYELNLLRERMLDYPVLAMDETRIQVLKEKGRAPESLSWLWVQRGGPPGHPIVLYDYDPSRGQQVPKRLLGDYGGFLQSDGYEAYAAVANANGIVQVGCWAHARRRFEQALKAQGKTTKGKSTSLAAQAVNRIGLLYKIERKAQRMSDEERLALRHQRAAPVLDALHAWLQEHMPRVPAQSALGKAMAYLHTQWPKLTVYATDGRLRIDNNLVENAIRPFVIGRKNFLFCDSVAGATSSANLYSLIETAKANGLQPYDYLKRIFTELPAATTVEQIEALLPAKPR